MSEQERLYEALLQVEPDMTVEKANEIFTRSNENKKPASKEKVLNMFRQLNVTKQKKVLKFMKALSNS